MVKFFADIKKSHSSSLVRQVLLITFFSVFSVFLFTCVTEIYKSYTDGEKEIITRTNALEETIYGPLENSLWEVDKASVTQILNVLLSDPNIYKAEIVNTDNPISVKENNKFDEWISLNYPINHKDADKKLNYLGTLKLSLSKSSFHQEIRARLFQALLKDLFRFLVIGVCVIWLLNKKIIGPMKKIQQMTTMFNNEHLVPILGSSGAVINDTSSSELEKLHADIHQLQENFLLAFKKQKEAENSRLEMELKLEKEKQKALLSQRLETIGQITAQVSHDFANILMIINGKVKVLQKSLNEESAPKNLEVIEKATYRAQLLCKKVLSYTRLQKEDTEGTFDPFQAVLEMEDLLEISIGREIDLHISSDGTPLRVEKSRADFENAVLNLCVNARDAMPTGGKIDIAFSSVVKGAQDYVLISILDTGPGIPEEIQLKIFDPFFTTKAVGKGTGLGLAQVQEFVKSAGGFLELKSGKDGTCFKLYIPNRQRIYLAA